MMIDLDVSSRYNALRRNNLHWLIVNIPGSNLVKGEVKTEYAS